MCSAVTETVPGSAITASCTRCSQPPQVMPATAIVSVTTALLGARARRQGIRSHRGHIGGDVLGVLALEQVRRHRCGMRIGEAQHDLLTHQRLERRVLEALGPRLLVGIVQVGADRALGTGVRQRVASAAGRDEQLLAVRGIRTPDAATPLWTPQPDAESPAAPSTAAVTSIARGRLTEAKPTNSLGGLVRDTPPAR